MSGTYFGDITIKIDVILTVGDVTRTNTFDPIVKHLFEPCNCCVNNINILQCSVHTAEMDNWAFFALIDFS